MVKVADNLAARGTPRTLDERLRQIRRQSYCVRPVLLKGAKWDEHGEVVWSTMTEPGGLWLKPCGDRRDARCPACAAVYGGDAFHVAVSGARGGKGVPETVSGHPLVFATLTAPSFGAVHSRTLGADGKPRRCRPRRDRPVCRHGRALSCSEIHGEDDACLGEPICPDCFDYRGALLGNNFAGELWRRTTIYLPRQLARLLGVTQKQLRQLVRMSYVKVAEYQHRGLIHFHVIVRLDRAMPAYRRDEVRRPDGRFTSALLEEAIRATVQAVAVPIPADAGGGSMTWGEQLDVQRIGDGGMDAGRCAGYLAKYATKATEQAGGVLHRVERRGRWSRCQRSRPPVHS